MRIAVVGVLANSILLFRGDMLRAMAAAGNDVMAMAPEDAPHVAAALKEMGVRYQSVPLRRAGMNPVKDLMTMVALARRFRRYRPDTVFVYAAKPVIYGSMAARLAGVKLRVAMITGVGSALGGGAGMKRKALSLLLRLLYRIGLHGVHVVFFQNPDDERLFRSLGLVGRTGQRIVQVGGSGVNLARFEVTPMPAGPITFLMIARLIRDKGVAEYVEAASRVRASHPEARFHLVGPLDSNPTAISQAELDGWVAKGDVEYLGATSDVRPFIAASTVYVLPSYGEGMPRSVLEAMAMARPIITTDVSGCRETVIEGRNGLLVPVKDPAALAHAMLKLIGETPERLAEMGRESRTIAEERFDVDVVNRTVLEAMGITPASGSGAAPGSTAESTAAS